MRNWDQQYNDLMQVQPEIYTQILAVPSFILLKKSAGAFLSVLLMPLKSVVFIAKNSDLFAVKYRIKIF